MRLELEVSIPYAESFPRVKPIILEALSTVPAILEDPQPLIGIEAFDSHNIIISIRPYISPDDYWEVTFAAYSAVKKAFNENGIQVAYSEGIELGKIGE